MTEKSEFNAEEWDTIVSGPAMAGAYLITAHKGGTVRETVSMAKVYTEARKAGGTGLLAQIVASNPPQPATRGQTVQEFRQGALDRLRAAVELLRARVLRILEQPRRERFLVGGRRFAEHARDEPRDGVDHHERGELAT